MVTKRGLLDELNTEFPQHWRWALLQKELPEFDVLPTIREIAFTEMGQEPNEIDCIELTVKVGDDPFSLRGHRRQDFDEEGASWDFTGRAPTPELAAYAAELMEFADEVLDKYRLEWDEWDGLPPG